MAENLNSAWGGGGRMLTWSKFGDCLGNGILSLAEVDKAIRDVLCIDELFDAKPAIMRAFQHAKSVSNKGDAKDDYIEFIEFRQFLLALRQVTKTILVIKTIFIITRVAGCKKSLIAKQ